MERKLASVQEVVAVEPIAGADNIEQIQVLGWRLIARKREFQPGDMCVFFEIDAILPDGPAWSEFMRERKFKVKTWRLAKFGVISQGLALPLSILSGVMTFGENYDHFEPYPISRWVEGDDVTNQLGVTKKEDPLIMPTGSHEHPMKPFPARVPKTDEMRLQSVPWVLQRMAGLPYYITLKYDGTSATFFYENSELVVASRNYTVDKGDNLYWQIAHKYWLDQDFTMSGIAIQGEIVGPGIQGNPLKLSKHELRVFSIYDTYRGAYFSFSMLCTYCAVLNLPRAEVLEIANSFNYTQEGLEQLARGFYPNTDNHREGIVVRPQEPRFDGILGQLSFKVVNIDYL